MIIHTHKKSNGNGSTIMHFRPDRGYDSMDIRRYCLTSLTHDYQITCGLTLCDTTKMSWLMKMS